MKKHLNEPDFIGGQGPLTEEEAEALTAYFAKKKRKASIPSPILPKPVRYENRS